jgi:hypothetical protein
MTYQARTVLDDCRVALMLLEEDVDDDKWRVHWAAAVALIRAVGHVLHKVDAKQNKVASDVIRQAYSRWQTNREEHIIFHEFIEKERNNLLKEYRSEVHPLGEVYIAIEAIAKPVNGGDAVPLREVLSLDENIYRPMVEGYFEGNDARDVLTEAIEWWESELNLIDADIANAT